MSLLFSCVWDILGETEGVALNHDLVPCFSGDPKIFELMSIWGPRAHHRWPIGVRWFATFLVFLGTSHGTKRTYRSAIASFEVIALLNIKSPFVKARVYPIAQVNIFMALATMASYKAASTVRVAKSAAEDTWLLGGNKGPVIDAVLWKRMYRGILVYKGTKLSEKTAILPSQIKKKIDLMLKNDEHTTINGASIILADLCGVLLGLRRAEFFASAEKNPNRATLLCFRNLAGLSWDLAQCSQHWDAAGWANMLALDEVIRIRLTYTKHYRHRVAHEVIAGPGFRLMSFIFWLKAVVRLRTRAGEIISLDSPLLVRTSRNGIVPMTGAFMTKMDLYYAPRLGWYRATIHSRRRGFATAMVRAGIHMASITIAMRHSQGVTMQYVALTIAEKASVTTRLAIAAYHSRADDVTKLWTSDQKEQLSS